MSKPIVMERGVKYRDADKMALIPVKNVATEREALLRKPEWMKIKLPADSTRIQGIKAAMRKNGLHSVCEEASCPNLAECFNHGTATFMILGAICTRRCPFCDVAHGRPVAPDANEPVKLAQTIADMALRYVVITSVDRDDLRDGGAQHFADCITAIREKSPQIKIETLVRLGETNEEIIEVMRDLRRHGVTMLTLGQYLQPSRHHLPVQRYVSPDEFDEMKAEALAMGFTHAACGPFVRSSYHADLQAKGMEVK